MFLETIFGKCLMTLAVSMLPVIELRGGIPLGIGLGLNPWLCMVISMLGNYLPIPFIIFFIRKIFHFLRKKSEWLERIVTRLENKALKNQDKVMKYELLGLALFVAIPLPGTGAWTGALIAAMLDMKIKKAMISIAAGVIVAGILVTLLSMGVISFF